MSAGADPVGLAAAWLDGLGGARVLVAEPPDAPSAARLVQAAPNREMEFATTWWPVARELRSAGMPTLAAHWWPAGDARFDAALVFLPKGWDRAAYTVEMVVRTVSPGAPIWVVGAKRAGIESAGSHLREWLDVESAEVGRHSRLLRARSRLGAPVASPAELGDPLATFERWRGVETRWGRVPVCDLPGVFGAGRVDDGTAMLLEVLPELGGRVVDVGCGGGVIGATVARAAIGCELRLIDADLVAVEAARRTLRASGTPATVEGGDVLVTAPVGLDAVVSNPPFHTGVATDYGPGRRLVAEAHERLRDGGRLVVVVNRFLDTLAQVSSRYRSAEVVREDPRYRVIVAER
ncbi:MAG: methyltransferase [Myxococcales bacterium]|nr:methyltransferase [Myxococcales bacterium]MCB9533246.1 methyltransferase [Myxococcales bacterium]